jgi:hypothetical protein
LTTPVLIRRALIRGSAITQSNFYCCKVNLLHGSYKRFKLTIDLYGLTTKIGCIQFTYPTHYLHMLHTLNELCHTWSVIFDACHSFMITPKYVTSPRARKAWIIYKTEACTSIVC